LEAQKNGLPTPLDSPPKYNIYLQQYLTRLWDMMQYKEAFDSPMSLSYVESYKRLFDIEIDPIELSIILQLDRAYIIEVNSIQQGN
jgi:hypothetical protein